MWGECWQRDTVQRKAGSRRAHDSATEPDRVIFAGASIAGSAAPGRHRRVHRPALKEPDHAAAATSEVIDEAGQRHRYARVPSQVVSAYSAR